MYDSLDVFRCITRIHICMYNVYIQKYKAKMKFALCLKVDSCELACAVHDYDSFSFSFLCFITLAIHFSSSKYSYEDGC